MNFGRRAFVIIIITTYYFFLFTTKSFCISTFSGSTLCTFVPYRSEHNLRTRKWDNWVVSLSASDETAIERYIYYSHRAFEQNIATLTRLCRSDSPWPMFMYLIIRDYIEI